MRGLVREAKGHTYEWGDTATLDAALISNAQRIVHYEMAGFGTAKEFSRCLRLSEVVEVLAELLEHAFATDKALTRIATGTWLTMGINQEAAEVPVHG
jgi:ferritin-like metal-binding protein YciE